MADGQGLPLGSEEHFLMGDEAAQADTVDVDPVNDGSASPVELALSGVRDLSHADLLPGSRDLAGGGAGGAGRGVDLVGVVQLDDLDRLVELRSLLGEVHHEHGTDGEIRGDQAAGVGMVGELVAQGLVAVFVKTRGADDGVDLVVGGLIEVVHDGVGGGEIDDDVGSLSG